MHTWNSFYSEVHCPWYAVSVATWWYGAAVFLNEVAISGDEVNIHGGGVGQAKNAILKSNNNNSHSSLILSHTLSLSLSPLSLCTLASSPYSNQFFPSLGHLLSPSHHQATSRWGRVQRENQDPKRDECTASFRIRSSCFSTFFSTDDEIAGEYPCHCPATCKTFTTSADFNLSCSCKNNC